MNSNHNSALVVSAIREMCTVVEELVVVVVVVVVVTLVAAALLEYEVVLEQFVAVGQDTTQTKQTNKQANKQTKQT